MSNRLNASGLMLRPRTRMLTPALAMSLCLTLASPLLAQTPADLRQEASFTAGASLGDGEAALASSVGLTFRLSGRMGLEVELAHARKLDFTLDLCPPPLVCVLGGQLPVTGRTVSLVPHLTFDLLPTSHPLRAYIVAGVGAGHVRQRHFSTAPATPMVEPVELTRSSSTIAVSFGGGVAVPISSRLRIGLDIRSLHLRDDEASLARLITPSGSLDTLRVGTRVCWRF